MNENFPMDRDSVGDHVPAGLHRQVGAIRLAVACVLLGLIWGVILPQIASLPRMQSYRQWLDDRGVDPSAMYYTELEAMEPILHRLERSSR